VLLQEGWVRLADLDQVPVRVAQVATDLAPDPNTSSSFLNIRVANIQEVYDDWSSKGAEFLTPPIDRGAAVG